MTLPPSTQSADERPAYLPSREKMSVFSAALVMALLEIQLVHLPPRSWNISPLGAHLTVHLSITGALALLVAAITAAGTDWLMRDHPSLKHNTITHWILPALTAWVLEILLQHLPLGLLWWVVLFVGMGVWFLVLLAEYIVIDANDLRYPIAASALNGLGFLLLFLMGVGVRSVPWRAFFASPALGLAAGLVALRAFHLRFPGRWLPVEAVIVATITAQIAASFYYLLPKPSRFGLVLVGVAYASTVFLGNALEEHDFLQSITEPVVVLILMLILLPWA